MLIVFASAYLAAAWCLDRYGQRRPKDSYDAIIVAGCRVMAGGVPSPALAHRVRRGVALWREGHGRTLVFTGGVGEHGPSEAQVAAELAISLGVPEGIVLREERSTSTDENARFAREILPGGTERVLVVTSAYHVFRCERVFGRYFGEVRGAGAIESAYPRVRGALREVFATLAYAALGRL